MSGFPKPCLTCGRRAEPGHARCALHERERDRAAKARRGPTPVSDTLSRRIRQVGSAQCSGCLMGYRAKDMRVDHIVPLIDGGLDSPDNVQVLCRWCHTVKTSEEARNRANLT